MTDLEKISAAARANKFLVQVVDRCTRLNSPDGCLSFDVFQMCWGGFVITINKGTDIKIPDGLFAKAEAYTAMKDYGPVSIIYYRLLRERDEQDDILHLPEVLNFIEMNTAMTGKQRIEEAARLHNYDTDQEDPGEFYVINSGHEFHVLENSADTFLLRPDLPDIKLPAGLEVLDLHVDNTILIVRDDDQEARLTADEVIDILKMNEEK